jgi:glycosyltransferase involved in cell wall biosynthesis
VPVHNSAAHLEACLTAISTSDLSSAPFELIVVDDASTDECANIAAKFTDSIIHTGDSARGPAFARNRGAESAHGDIIAFVDSDVVLHPDVLRLMAERIEGNSLVAVFGSYDLNPSSKSTVSQFRNLLHHYAHLESAGRVATFWAGCGAVNATAFRKVGGFDENKYPRPQIEDVELGYRLAQVGAIELDPTIQCTHLKRWTVGSMLRTDFFDRAVPWVKLLLSRKAPSRGPSPSLGGRAILGTATSGMAVATAFLAIATTSWWIGAVAIALLLLNIAINARLYRFLFERGGMHLLAAGIPLHFLYQVESAAAIPVGIGSYLLESYSVRTSAL